VIIRLGPSVSFESMRNSQPDPWRDAQLRRGMSLRVGQRLAVSIEVWSMLALIASNGDDLFTVDLMSEFAKAMIALIAAQRGGLSWCTKPAKRGWQFELPKYGYFGSKYAIISIIIAIASHIAAFEPRWARAQGKSCDPRSCFCLPKVHPQGRSMVDRWMFNFFEQSV